MKLSHTIIFVPDPKASATFFEKAFGFTRRFVHETGYTEMDTGETALGFSPLKGARDNLGRVVAAAESDVPLGMEFVFTTNDVYAAYDRAITAGALPVKEPTTKPWGQVLSWVRCPDGTLVELISPPLKK